MFTKLRTRQRVLSTLLILTTATTVVLAQSEKIAFVSDRDANDEIYVMARDGSGQTRLTHNPSTDASPAFSFDGTRIAFSSYRDGNYEIYVMDADGSDQTRLTFDPREDIEPTWSPDGSKIAFVRDYVQLVVMDADGSGANVIFNAAIEGLQGPDWSPDGSTIVFSQYDFLFSGLYTISPAGGVASSIPTGDGGYFIEAAYGASYSPAGSRIAFVFSALNLLGGPDLHQTRSIGSDGQMQMVLVNGPSQYPDYSPDGTKIAFSGPQNAEPTTDIFVINADGSGLTNITNSNSTEYDPSWGDSTGVMIAGQIRTPDGRGLRNAVVSITDGSGSSRSVTTNAFGSYSIPSNRRGQVYTLSVSSKRFRFESRVVRANIGLNDVDFVGSD